MTLRLATATAMASIYGNSGLDAIKGHSRIVNTLADARRLIFYWDDSLTNRSTSSISDTEKQLLLFQEIQKHVSKEAIEQEYKDVHGVHEEEVHVLGGKKARA